MEGTKSTAGLIKDFRAAPGISIPHLLPNTKVLVETTLSVFELRVIDYEHVEITGTDHRFHTPIIGRFIQSVYDVAGAIKFPGWIGKNLRMDIEFKDAMFRSTPVVAGCVIGEGYRYDVFGP